MSFFNASLCVILQIQCVGCAFWIPGTLAFTRDQQPFIYSACSRVVFELTVGPPVFSWGLQVLNCFQLSLPVYVFSDKGSRRFCTLISLCRPLAFSVKCWLENHLLQWQLDNWNSLQLGRKALLEAYFSADSLLGFWPWIYTSQEQGGAWGIRDGAGSPGVFWIVMIPSQALLLRHTASLEHPSLVCPFRCCFWSQALLQSIFSKHYLRVRCAVFVLTWGLIKHLLFLWTSLSSSTSLSPPLPASCKIFSGIHVDRMCLSMRMFYPFCKKCGFKYMVSLTSITDISKKEKV